MKLFVTRDGNGIPAVWTREPRWQTTRGIWEAGDCFGVGSWVSMVLAEFFGVENGECYEIVLEGEG